jgi:hypothetical protein
MSKLRDCVRKMHANSTNGARADPWVQLYPPLSAIHKVQWCPIIRYLQQQPFLPTNQPKPTPWMQCVVMWQMYILGLRDNSYGDNVAWHLI